MWRSQAPKGRAGRASGWEQLCVRPGFSFHGWERSYVARGVAPDAVASVTPHGGQGGGGGGAATCSLPSDLAPRERSHL